MWDDRFEDVLRGTLAGLGDEPLAADACLRSAGLDSLATIELLLRLEEAYDVSLPDELLTGATFATPASLWQTIDRLRSAAPAH
jgi:diaminopimelate decarboxylase